MQRIKGALVVLVGLTLGGCSGASTANTASSTPTSLPSVAAAVPSATPSDSASPTPVPSTSAPATTQTTHTAPPVTAQGDPCTDPSVSFDGLAGIDFDRYAKICLGMSFAAASAAMPGPPVNGESVCPWYALLLTVQDPGLYVAAITRPDNPGAAISMFRMTWEGDPAAAAAFGAPKTVKGISVGSTTAEVTTAYPAATAISINDIARGARTQLVVAGPGGTSLVFDVTSGMVSDMYWGTGISQGVSGELCNA
ncbi:hypothetical protein [Demequina lutea]|uniref:Uncharacterized protein n=1 Tax=Demequina lutea TaxID=431489 RepID=A0A7Y9ZA88_9MICO|nr:hypothetical protein [Demequina lutea]NYI41652.1 hypothetical protein [Demequina lutea]